MDGGRSSIHTLKVYFKILLSNTLKADKMTRIITKMEVLQPDRPAALQDIKSFLSIMISVTVFPLFQHVFFFTIYLVARSLRHSSLYEITF